MYDVSARSLWWCPPPIHPQNNASHPCRPWSQLPLRHQVPSYDWCSPFNMTAGLCWVPPPGSALARGTRMRNWTGVTSQWPKPTNPQHEPNTTKALLLESAALSQNFHYTTQKMRSVNILSSALSHVQRNWLMFFWSSYLIFSCIFYVSCSQKSDTRWH